MSLILKGIDLPTKDQVIVIHSDGTFNEVDPFARRLMPFYEAIQMPKDHGRLIDGDALYKFFEDALNKNALDDWWEAGAVLDNIELAPTILESEGER